MSPIEIAWGYVLGHEGTLDPAQDDTVGPREALERVVAEALQRPPCGVAFSGGRDSSAILAVATHVARREGLPDPIPITRAFPDVPESDERDWQDAVVRHLDLREWQRLEFRDELDVVGPVAAQHLVEHGVVWPPSIASDVPMVEAVRGGSLIDGEGGDEVLGADAHRVAPLTRLIRSPRSTGWRAVRSALGTLAPARVRTSRAPHRNGRLEFIWLRPTANSKLLAGVDEMVARQPLSYAASVRMIPRQRMQLLAARNRRILAAARDCSLSSPLLHAEFVHALARDGRLLGSRSRTVALRSLVADLLPDAVLTRTTKATFTRSYMARHSREFVTSWDGGGVDSDLVDPDELRRIWLSDEPFAPTSALLQTAWLASAPAMSSEQTGCQEG